jgi:hypothetical protein
MRKIISGTALSLTAVLGTALGLAVPGVAAAAYSNCASGYVCFYTEQNGGGSKCSWYADDPDWTTGSIKCSWATTSNVRSIANMGTSKSYVGVAYYSGANYGSRMGCTRQGDSGNLRGDYKLRSHKWLATGQACG